MFLLDPYRFGIVYDTDAQAYIAAVEAADGQALELAVKNAINAFVVGCKADGIWSAIKASCILAGARTLTGALIPLVGSAPTNFNFVEADYNRKTGLKGDGSTKYLDSNRAGNADPQNDMHQAVWVTEVTTISPSMYIGNGIEASNSTTGLSHIGNSAGSHYARNRSTNASANFSRNPGFLGTSRNNSSNYIFRVNSTNNTVTAASSTPPSNTHKDFALRLQSGSPVNVSEGRQSFRSIGTSLTLSLLEARVATLMTALDEAIV